MRRNTNILWGIFITATLAGCGPSTGGSNTFSTSVPSSAQVQNLTPGQAGQICGDITAYVIAQLDSPDLCRAAAVAAVAGEATKDASLTDAQLQQLCSYAATTLCAQLKADGGAANAGAGSAPSCGSTAGCAATVAEVSTCVNDVGASFTTFERMFPSCSIVTRARLATVNQEFSVMEPASCVPLDTSCPGFGPMISVGAMAGMD